MLHIINWNGKTNKIVLHETNASFRSRLENFFEKAVKDLHLHLRQSQQPAERKRRQPLQCRKPAHPDAYKELQGKFYL